MSITIPTTDVTNRGNKPGDGPLRAGGVEGSRILQPKDLPSTRSPSSERQEAATLMMRDLWEGTHAMRAAAQQYLPQAPGETSAAYQDRLSRAVFFNATRRTVEGLAGLVFQKDPALKDDVPKLIRGDEAVVGHWENIDGEGTHGDVFARDLLQDSLLVGHTAILVDFPKTGGRLNRAEEAALGVRPYWVAIRKEDILSWRTDQVGGARVLTQLVLRETRQVPVGEFGETAETLYRVFYRDERGLVGFRLLGVTKEQSVVLVDEGTYPTLTEIPVAEVKTSGARSMFDSDPPLLDLGYLNVAHYQQWSDYAYAIHKTNVPFLFGKGLASVYDEAGKKIDKIVVGPNTSILDEGQQADMKYVAHDGASLGESRQALEDLKNDMGTLGLAMLAPQKRVAETAEAKRLDKSVSDSALAVAARALQDALERALGFHAQYLRLEDGGSVTINRDFEALLMEASVMTAFAALVDKGFPVRPVLEALVRFGRLDENADLDALELEWMMGQEFDKQLPEES